MVRALSVTYGYSVISSTAKESDLKIASAVRNTLLNFVYKGVLANFTADSLHQETYFKPFNVRYGNDSLEKLGIVGVY
jgi:hypothetical protein